MKRYLLASALGLGLGLIRLAANSGPLASRWDLSGMLLAFPIAVVVGWVCDRGGVRPAIMVLGIVVGALVALALAPGLGLVLPIGIVIPGFFVVATKALVTWIPTREQIRAQGLLLALPLVLIVAHPASRAPFELRGLASATLPLALFGLVVLLLALWYRDDPRDSQGLSPRESALLERSGSIARARADKPLRTVLALPATWALGLAYLLIQVGGRGAGVPSGSEVPLVLSLAPAVGALGAGAAEAWLARDDRDALAMRPWLGLWACWMAALAPLVVLLGDSPIVLGASLFVAWLPLPVLWAHVMRMGGKYAGTMAAVVYTIGEAGLRLTDGWGGTPLVVASLLLAGLMLLKFIPKRAVPVQEPPVVRRPLSPVWNHVCSGLCYVPYLQLGYLLFGWWRAARLPDVRFHAVTALLAWVTFLVALLASLPFGLELLPAIVGVGIVVMAAAAFVRPSFRFPVLSAPAERLTRPPLEGQAPLAHGSSLAAFASWGLVGVGGLIVVTAMSVPSVGLTSAGPSLGIAFGAALIVFGRRFGARSAQRSLARASSAPVLYLRSFATDEYDEGNRPDEVLGAREEQILADLFRAVGPVVAVGRPGERLPQLGAARMYFGSDEWQPGVLDLMKRAQLVLLRVGHSRGLLWEVQNAVRTVPPTDLVFYFSHRLYEGELEQLYEDFAVLTKEVFPVPLPEAIDRERFLVFDADWRPHLIGRTPTTRWSLARLAGPPIGPLLQEALVRSKLSRGLREWFSGRGLSSYPVRLFGRAGVVGGAIMGGPLGGGIMISWNYLRMGLKARAAFAVGATALLTACIVLARPWWESSSPMGQEFIGTFAALAFGAIALVSYHRLMPPGVKRHFLVGGRRVAWVWTLMVMLALSMAWLTLLDPLRWAS